MRTMTYAIVMAGLGGLCGGASVQAAPATPAVKTAFLGLWPNCSTCPQAPAQAQYGATYYTGPASYAPAYNGAAACSSGRCRQGTPAYQSYPQAYGLTQYGPAGQYAAPQYAPGQYGGQYGPNQYVPNQYDPAYSAPSYDPGAYQGTGYRQPQNLYSNPRYPSRATAIRITATTAPPPAPTGHPRQTPARNGIRDADLSR